VLFLLHSKYDWPRGKTASGKVIYQLDFVPVALVFFFLANLLWVCGWQLLSDDLPATYLLLAMGSVSFIGGVPFAFRRKRLVFDPAGRTVRLVTKGVTGRSEKTWTYSRVRAKTFELSRRAIGLSLSMEGFGTTLARGTPRKIAEVVREFESDTGMEVRKSALPGADRPPAGGG